MRPLIKTSSSSRSDPKPRNAKEPMTEEKPTLEAMFEMMKSLTLFTKDIARTREHDRNRNAYGPRPYWNNQRGPIDENMQNPRRNEPTENRNVNTCEVLETFTIIFTLSVKLA